MREHLGERRATRHPERQVPHRDRRVPAQRIRQVRAGPGTGEHGAGKRQVLRDRQVVIEAETLRQVADPPPGRPRRGLPEQPHRPAGDRKQSEQHADQGGLARAVGAEQPDHLAGADREIHPVDRGEPAEDPAHSGAFGEYLGVGYLSAG